MNVPLRAAGEQVKTDEYFSAKREEQVKKLINVPPHCGGAGDGNCPD